MRIVTWTDDLDDYTHTDRPKTLRLSPQDVSAKPDAVIELVAADTQAIIMPCLLGRHHRSDQQVANWLAEFGELLRRYATGLRTIWIDHPPNDWRRHSNGEVYDRRHQQSRTMFRGHMALLEPFAAVQYGLLYSTDDRWSPVLWTVRGTSLLLSDDPVPAVMPWLRGIGQWAPNSYAPTQRSFLHDLLTCWRVGCTEALVWYDPSNTTDLQLQQMADCIDLVAGMSWTCDDEPADNDMSRLLETLAGGAQFTDILETLARWGGTGGEESPDLEVRGE